MKFLGAIDQVVFNVLGTSPGTVPGQVKDIARAPGRIKDQGVKKSVRQMGQGFTDSTQQPIMDAYKKGGKAGAIGAAVLTAPAQALGSLADFGARASIGEARKCDLVDQPLNVLLGGDLGAMAGVVKMGTKATTASAATQAALLGSKNEGASLCADLPTLKKSAATVAGYGAQALTAVVTPGPASSLNQSGMTRVRLDGKTPAEHKSSCTVC
jgi:hypothetical protein